MMLTLEPGSLDLEGCINFAFSSDKIKLSSSAHEKIQKSRQVVEEVIKKKKIIYGINTGFGALANQVIPMHQLELLQKNLLLSHACGVGEYASDETIRLMLLLKINALSRGYSGVRQELIDMLIFFLNHGMYPLVPKKGSVGASGDLAPLAHLFLPLIGEGKIRYLGEIYPSKDILSLFKKHPLILAPKEGLALINGLQASTAFLMMAYQKVRFLFESAVICGAMMVDAAMGSVIPFSPSIHEVRGHDTQRKVAALMKAFLEPSGIREAHSLNARVQDPYSLRCQPQILGAILSQIDYVASILTAEVNAVTDNPLVFADTNQILSGGNFHGEMLAMAADNLALAIAEIGALSERRIAMIIDPAFSGLPAFLVKDNGINSGFMVMQVTATAAASDNKALSHPHCVDSIPTSLNQEDHVSMATNAALRLEPMIENTATILAIELMAAAQGIELRLPLKTSEVLDVFVNKVREHVAFYDKDRYVSDEIQKVRNMILSGEFSFETNR